MNPLDPLIEQLKKFPGIGEKSAQRLAFYVLGLSQQNVNQMAESLVTTRESIRYCDRCFNISLEALCHVCNDPKRDVAQLCIVAEPRDIFAIERTHAFKGYYHVLGGLISPLDGVQPELLRIKELTDRLGKEPFKELLFAINPTVEGDTTVMYLTSVLSAFDVSFTRLSYGLPMGADIDYVDEITLTKAISSRRGVDLS